jgi:hypothetical protein
MIVVIFVITSILTGGGNSVGNTFRYLIPCFAIYGFAKPKHAIYLLFIISPFLDQIKRFMIFDFRLTEFDLALILATAPILMVAIFLRTSMDCLFHPSKDNRKTLLYMALVGLLVVAFIVASSQAAGKLGVRGLGVGVNAGIYMLLIPILPHYFTQRSEYAKLLLICTLIYLIPSLWCIKQGIWGLADFEAEYVRYGLSGEIRQLNEKVFRNPGTLQSAAAMSCAASIFLALYLLPVVMKTGKIQLISILMPHRVLLFVVFSSCMYFTYSRTPWVAVIAIIAFYVCLHSRVLLIGASIIGLTALTTLYLSAQWMLDQQIFNKWQAALILKYGGDAGVEQTLVLGTLNGRLESMANLVHGRDDVWQPFGVGIAKFLGSKHAFNIAQHDMITENIVKFGYIPCSITIIIIAFLGIKFVKMNSILKSSPERNSARVYLAIVLGIQIIGFSHGATLQTYPLNMFIAFFLAAAIYHYRLAINYSQAQTINDLAAPENIQQRNYSAGRRPIGVPSVAQNLSS